MDERGQKVQLILRGFLLRRNYRKKGQKKKKGEEEIVSWSENDESVRG